jgi:D-alanyl-D-alanine carboxypeptidase
MILHLVFSILTVCIINFPAQANPTLVIDVETGFVLHADQEDIPWYPASLTKLMTAYLTFKHLNQDTTFSFNTQLTVSKRASSQPASKMGVPTGSTVSVARALDALIIYSANDIAYVLAEGVSGSVERFVEKMNEAAHELGMSATSFTNPNGLPDSDQITTARDMAVLGRALILEFPEYGYIFANPILKWGKRKLHARNSLLRTFDGADGMKTGFICASGFNVVATAKRDQLHFLVVVMGASSGKFRSRIAANLLDSAFERGGAPMINYTKLGAISNNSNHFVSPANLRSQVCAKKGAHPIIATPEKLYGWGVLFGSYKSRKSASSALGFTLKGLRGVVDHGLAAIVPATSKKSYHVVLAGISVDKALDICDHFDKAALSCTPLSPGEVREASGL